MAKEEPGKQPPHPALLVAVYRILVAGLTMVFVPPFCISRSWQPLPASSTGNERLFRRGSATRLTKRARHFGWDCSWPLPLSSLCSYWPSVTRLSASGTDAILAGRRRYSRRPMGGPGLPRSGRRIGRSIIGSRNWLGALRVLAILVVSIVLLAPGASWRFTNRVASGAAGRARSMALPQYSPSFRMTLRHRRQRIRFAHLDQPRPLLRTDRDRSPVPAKQVPTNRRLRYGREI